MTPEKNLVAIGVGSNVGDRQFYMCQALSSLDRLPELSVLRASCLYESAGWGRENLKPFLNAVIVAETTLTPKKLLRQMMTIEDQLGRQRELKWGPRTLDLDMLAYADEQSDDEELRLPHPWISRRPFVYLPFQQVIDGEKDWEKLVIPHEEGMKIEKDSTPFRDGDSVWGGKRRKASERVTVYTFNEEETLELGRQIAPYLMARDLVTLAASVGAGKSVFTRGVARGMGIRERIQSPSYTLCREYEGTHYGLQHWDFYRLVSIGDLESTGFTEPCDHVRIIEWAERFPEEHHAPLFSLSIHIEGEFRRRLQFDSPSNELPFFVEAQGMKQENIHT